MRDLTLSCSACGKPLPLPKNWTRLSRWRRQRPRRCRSCANTRHGMARSRLHREWAAMRNRCGLTACSNPAAQKYYIDKGIGVWAEWDHFVAFAEWATAHGYRDDLSLDRIDSNRDYGPDNCRWVSLAENLRARRDRRLNWDKVAAIRRRAALGEKASHLAREYGVNPSQIYRVINHTRWAA